jgi:hypothetical protein
MKPSRTEGGSGDAPGGSGVLMARLRRPRTLGVRLWLGALAVAAGLMVPTGAAFAQTGDSGSIIIGDPGQSAQQNQSTSQSNTQDAGTGSITLGDTAAGNDQQAVTNQHINQEQSGTFIVFDGALHQIASQNASTVQDNTQLSGLSGGLVVGDTSLNNTQHATTNQDINQVMDGTFLVFGDTFAVDSRITGAVNSLNGCAACADAMRGGPVLAGGDYRAGDSEDGTYIVFGDFTQAASQNASTVENNHQDMTGSIILGDTELNNDQQAVTNQKIDQSLHGTYIVFGTLDQTADQNASTIQTNEQEHG